jgi:hypothetical protein
MPSEQPPANNGSGSSGTSRERRPAGVRTLLGLPSRERGQMSSRPLTAPSGRALHGHSLWQVFKERDESVGGSSPHAGIIDEERETNAGLRTVQTRTLNSRDLDVERHVRGSLRRDNAMLSLAAEEAAAISDTTAGGSQPGQATSSSLAIPGISRQRTGSRLSIQATVDAKGDSPNSIPEQAAQFSARASASRGLRNIASNAESFVRSEPSVARGASPENVAVPRSLSSSSAQSPAGQFAHMEIERSRRGEQDLADRFEQLRRTVGELAASLEALALQNRLDSQSPRRERAAATQRAVVAPRPEASSAVPRAFWDRSRIGRLSVTTRR